jgi:hypothetical protein
MGVIGNALHKTEDAQTDQTNTQASQPTPTAETPAKKYNYEILDKQANKAVENISVLVKEDETEGEAIAMEVKGTCTKPCNISVYDTRKAFDLNQSYKNLTDQAQIEAWRKQNYVYVADHLIGDINFELGTYSPYPLRDWQYDELKGKQ